MTARRVVVQPPESDRWRRRGACVGDDQTGYFSDDEGEFDPNRGLEACAACPVQVECLAHALWSGERYGIWGGTTEEQRREMARTYHGTPEHYVDGCRCVPCRRAYVAKRQSTTMIQEGLAWLAAEIRELVARQSGCDRVIGTGETAGQGGRRR